MSRLDELIAELCPDGVEYKKIGDCCEVLTGGEAPEGAIKGKEPIDEFIYPIYSNGIGDNALWGFSKDYRIDRQAVSFSAIGTIGYPTLREAGFTPIIRLKVIYPKSEKDLDIRYLKYSLETVEFEQQKSSVPNVNANMIKRICIPVPPLPVQQEIVRILDHFTELIAELNAELTARKKQYEYYRDILLLSHETTEYTVQDLIDLKMIDEPMDGNHGELHPKKADYVSSGVPFIMANNLVNGSLDYDNCAFITEKQAATLRKGFAKPGDVLLTHKGTIGRTAIVPESFSSIVLTPQVTYYRIKKGIDNRYLKHYFDSAPFQAQITDIAGLGGTRAYIGITAQRALRIRMPSLEDQRDISLKLECFDKLYNNLTSGLPAEIAARQKQYEYYRDKLLTFKELPKS